MRRIIVCILFFIASKIYAQVVFSEIMFYPSANYSEFIELYNTSNKDTIDLNKWLILYHTSKPDTIISAGFGTKLHPNQYAVIFPSNIDLNQNPYVIYGSPLILKINDNNFGSSGMANTTDRTLKLIKNNDTIDTYTYIANNKQGYSDEKYNVNDLYSLWGNSIKLNGTPGYKNSISPIDFDIEIKDITVNDNKHIFLFDTLSFEVKLINKGIKSYNFNLIITLDFDFDDIADSLLYQTNLNIPPKDSIILLIPKKYYFTKEATLLIEVISEFDEIQENNKKIITLMPSVNYNDIIINEVMFYPANGEPEWVELYNRSNSKINLKNFIIKDNSKNSVTILSDLYILPQQYLVITKSEDIINFHNYSFNYYVLPNLPNLNNDYDAVVIKDTYGNTIDSLFYNSSFKPKAGFSIERIDVNQPTNLLANWGVSLSIEQSTPGIINSLSPKNKDLAIKDIFPVHDGNDTQIGIILQNKGKETFFFNYVILQKNISSIFIDYKTINYNNFIAANDEVTLYTGLISNDSIAGLYRAIILNDDEDLSNNNFTKEIFAINKQNEIVISEIMFSPDTDEPEWVEIYNLSNKSINLKNWYISDLINPTKAIITNSDYYLPPNSFGIIAYDSLKFKNKYKNINGKVIQAKFGALSDNDGVMIYDANNIIIDSVDYTNFSKQSRKSIEKIKLDGNSNDKNNWSICLRKATPMDYSTYHNLTEYNFESIVFSEIMYDPATNNCEFVEIYNKNNHSINIEGWKFNFDNKNFLIADTTIYLSTKGFYILTSNDSIFSNYNISKDSLKNRYTVYNINEFGLTTTGKKLYLLDAFNNIIDSMWYDNMMHKFIKTTKNISLEKINFNLPSNFYTNWGSSLALKGGTPFAKNSIEIENKNTNSNIELFPNPFSPDGDGFEDFTTITLNLKNNINKIRIKIFDAKGRLIKNLITDELVPQKYSIIYDGTDDNNRKLPIGVYILYVESKNSENFNSEVYKKVFVIGKK